MPTISYDADVNTDLIKNKRVAVIGYGSQGHAHASNLKDSGVDVVVGLREGSARIQRAEADGHKVMAPADAVHHADVVMILLPDQHQARFYDEVIAGNLEPGDLLLFAHGFSIHFGYITPPESVNVAMVAPKGPGHLVRRTYQESSGVPALVAVEQDPSGDTLDLALSYASAIGAGRA
ncbi:MAG: NAD(P)-binding domain-containing protein, partial [Acidimicrobiia bacterium]|nr:NAD(P)-binding domain-containing protein [Acidimicrobiia bacterium]